ncbi:MAG: fatty acid desaturase [Bacteroidota bacterium]
MTQKDFHISSGDQPHIERCKEILKKHPEVANLMGKNPYTFLILLGLVGLQTGIAIWMGILGTSYWWLSLVIAYLVGAFANHTLYVVIHEATHNMIFKKRVLNRWSAVMADLVNAVPGAMGFHTYHLKHHAHLGDFMNDTDLASHWEAKLVGNSSWRKALWLALFPIFQILRTFRLTHVNTWTKWMFINIFMVFAFDALLIYFFGWNAVIYTFASMMFALGLHPLGARWIQEHYTTDGGQETHSYYGPLNKIALNMGYHNEHHDFPSIPWNRLPELKKMAPEYYDNLEYHSSWSKLVLQFVFNPEYSLYSRVRRAEGDPSVGIIRKAKGKKLKAAV